MTRAESLIASIRARPGMYVGSTHDGSGVHQMLWEIVSNSLDEHLAGRASRVAVTFNDDGSISVEDDGAGFPLHLVDVALTSEQPTGTRDDRAPRAHVGVHGVGLCPVNALSSALSVDVFREGLHHRQRFAEGERVGELEQVGTCQWTGTRITFTPDAKIFSTIEMSFDVVQERLRELSLLHPGLDIQLRDNRLRRRSFHHPEGLRGFLDAPADAFVCHGVSNDVRVDAALRWGPTQGWSARLRSFANAESTTDHGTHVDGLLRGIADAVAPELPIRRRYSARMREAIAGELQAVVHVNIPDPKFAGPTKGRLTSPEATEAVRAVVAEQLVAQLEQRPDVRESLRRATWRR